MSFGSSFIEVRHAPRGKVTHLFWHRYVRFDDSYLMVQESLIHNSTLCWRDADGMQIGWKGPICHKCDRELKAIKRNLRLLAEELTWTDGT